MPHDEKPIDPKGGRPRSPHDVPPRTIALIFGVMVAGLAIGMLLVMPHYGPRKPRRKTALGHIVPTSMIGRETNGMMWVPGGTFLMGSNTGQKDEAPVHEVTVGPIWMDKAEVTNEQFDKFVQATGYLTVAERKPEPKDFPGADSALLVPGSAVFSPPSEPVPIDDHYLWWKYLPGANWRQPEGPGSTIVGREKHPVVHVAWEDAASYAKWAGKRLPTEAEWEHAARGGLSQQPYVWGNTPPSETNANVWQGEFPLTNTVADGFRATAPVASFPPNGYGLYDMAGNVWEWCGDWYAPEYYAQSEKSNPKGPPQSHDPAEPQVPKRVIRGGSFLCSDAYCTGYRPSARMKAAADTGTSHIGFRCVKDGF